MFKIYQQNYKKLETILGENWENLSHVVIENDPFMKLHFEHLWENNYAIAHYYKENGDLVPDPDMEIRVNREQKLVEAVSYQDLYGYKTVYPYPDKLNFVNLKARASLNKFLSFWLSNIIRQGFRRKAA